MSVLVAASLAGTVSAAPILRITEVMSNGDTADWFEVTNYGDASATITGYRMDDNSFANAAKLSVCFPNDVTTIAPGESVVFGGRQRRTHGDHLQDQLGAALVPSKSATTRVPASDSAVREMA